MNKTKTKETDNEMLQRNMHASSNLSTMTLREVLDLFDATQKLLEYYRNKTLANTGGYDADYSHIYNESRVLTESYNKKLEVIFREIQRHVDKIFS